MSLFQCDGCGTRENTATSDGGYLAHILDRDGLREKGLNPDGVYCSECYTGKWHGRFPKEFYPMGTMMTDREGNLSRREKRS